MIGRLSRVVLIALLMAHPGGLMRSISAALPGSPPDSAFAPGPADSADLLTRAAASGAPPARLAALLALTDRYRLRGDSTQGFATGRQALALARARPNRPAEARALYLLGRQALSAGNLPVQYAYLQQQFRLARRLPLDTLAAVRARGELAWYYFIGGQRQRSLEEAYRVVPFAESDARADAELRTRLYVVLGGNFQQQNLRPRALDYQRRALQAADTDPALRIHALMNLSSAQRALDSLGAASRSLRVARNLALTTGQSAPLPRLELQLGQLAAEARDTATALASFEASLSAARLLSDPLTVCIAATSLAEILTHRGQPARAAALAREAVATAHRTANGELEFSARDVLSQALFRLGQPAAALAEYRAFIALRDSVNDRANQQRLTELEGGFRLDQKNRQIALLTARQRLSAAETATQRVTLWGLLGGLVLVSALAVVLGQRFRFQRRTTAALAHEKQRSDELLRNILPAEVAEELKETGRATARHHEQVTVLFADVEDFTQLSERLPAAALVSALDAYFAAFDAIADEFRLEKIKTIGDAYLMAGGLSAGPGAAPAAAVRAALAMQHTVAAMRAAREAAGLPCFRLRIGLHTGPVVAGVVGVRKFAYDIWGDTVNLAARMEQSGEAGRINISEATYHLVSPAFTCIPRGRIAAKHKGEVAMYFVEAEVSLPSPSPS